MEESRRRNGSVTVPTCNDRRRGDPSRCRRRDRLARPERARQRPADDPRQGARGDRGPQLPAEPARTQPLVAPNARDRRRRAVLHESRPRSSACAASRRRSRAPRTTSCCSTSSRRTGGSTHSRSSTAATAPTVAHRLVDPARRRGRAPARRRGYRSCSSTRRIRRSRAVVVDDVDGGELATTQLIELGHRRIAFVGDKSPDPFRFASSRDRTRGYERALAHAGIELRPEYVREGTQSHHVARSIAIDLLRLPSGRRRSSRRRTRRRSACSKRRESSASRVPEELSVVGFDDIDDRRVRRADDRAPAALRERSPRRRAAPADAGRRGAATRRAPHRAASARARDPLDHRTGAEPPRCQ